MTALPRNGAERRAFGETLARQHGITVKVSRAVRGTGGSSNWRDKSITVPPDWYTTPEGFGTFLHECGHVLAGPCPQRPPHYRDLAITDSWACLECEREAWVQAMRLVPEFSRDMFDDLQRALRTYRRRIRAYPAATRAARQLASDATYYGRVHERAKRQMQIEDIRRIGRMAAAPRVLSRREQMIAEIRAIAREVQR